MKVQFAGIVQGPEEFEAVERAMKSGWQGPGVECEMFEQEFAEYVGSKYALLTNSGSSANLLALKALNLPAGSKVLTSGCGFPATLNPILHCGLTPVLVDYDFDTQNIDLNQVEEELFKAEPDGIQAIIFAHTMGSSVDMARLMVLADQYNVAVIEDSCEAIGSKFNDRCVGTFGKLGTYSFYPSHIINGCGGGGAIVTDDKELALRMRSLRNWGKVARTPSFGGDHHTDFAEQVDGIPYDAQYCYQTVGFNLQPTDIQGAYLREQLKRLPEFIRIRKENWEYLNANIKQDWIKTMQVIDGSEPAYFGYSMVLQVEGQRDKFAKYLEENGIRCRPLFAGNITKHEPYKFLGHSFPVGEYFMRNGLFTGVFQGLNLGHMEYVSSCINAYKLV